MNHKVSKFLLLLVATIGMTSCWNDNDNDEAQTQCDQLVLISSETFISASADPLFVHSVEIDDDCLLISFSASGCDGNTWEVELIDSDVIMESQPHQRNLRLSLLNLELCDAVISKTISFDVSELQVNGNQLQLHLVNSGYEILYTY